MLRASLKKYALGVFRYFPHLRQLARKCYYHIRACRYNLLSSSTPTQPDTILFESYGGRQFACTPKALFEQMQVDERFSHFCYIWAFDAASIAKFRKLPELEKARLVERGTKPYFKACAEAKYWIINTRIPEYVKPKPDQVYVQCWHGTPLKRLGYDVKIQTQSALNTTQELAKRFGIDSQKWSYLISPSSYTSKHLTSAFGLPDARKKETVIEEGYPRNDDIARMIHSPEAEKIRATVRSSLGISGEKRVLLYAPTWRDSAYRAGVGYILSDLLNLKQLQCKLDDEWVILFRAHYYIANQLDLEASEGFVIDVSKYDNINDLYIAADVLLTDYSSVLFDFLNTYKPIIFYWPDYNRYENELRGFYFDPKILPGPYCTTADEVITELKKMDDYYSTYKQVYHEAKEMFCPKDDGYATLRVIDKLFFS